MTWLFFGRRFFHSSFSLNMPFFCDVTILSLWGPPFLVKLHIFGQFFFSLQASLSFFLSFHAFDVSVLRSCKLSQCFLSSKIFFLSTPPIPFSSSSTTNLSHICNPQKNCLLQQYVPSLFAIKGTVLAKACFFFPFLFYWSQIMLSLITIECFFYMFS